MDTKDLGNELEMCQIALMKRGEESNRINEKMRRVIL